jgi:glycosyltransferase involved in cell wall biosynthesis
MPNFLFMILNAALNPDLILGTNSDCLWAPEVLLPACDCTSTLIKQVNSDAQVFPSARVPLLSVVIPAYNERATIEEIISRVQAVGIDKEIVVVDDGSTDGTREILTHLARRFAEQPSAEPVRIFFQEKNRGKGAALHCGFKEACGEIVIIQDADLELDPQEYSKLIEPIREGRADVVYGSRFLGRSRHEIPLLYFLGNKVLTQTSNALTGLGLTDVWTGFKVFRREVLSKIILSEERFGFEPEVTAKLAKLGCRVHELPVSYVWRSRDKGKKIRWKDAIRGMWCTLRYSIFS